MSVRSTETEESAGIRESMIQYGATEAARQAIAMVELSGGQVSNEAVDLGNRAEAGELSHEEVIGRLVERHTPNED